MRYDPVHAGRFPSYVEAPPEDTVICRFMDFDKFRDLFGNEELYLRRTDLFKEGDPWEAAAIG